MSFFLAFIPKTDLQATQIISTVAGTGVSGDTGDGGLATAARIANAYSAFVDAAGNIFIADSGNSLIRKVEATTGIISTVAGCALGAGFSGDGGLATAAQLNYPYDIFVDVSGTIYIADSANHRIRKVEATTGKISTVAGDGVASFAGDTGAATAARLNDPQGVCVDASGNIYIADKNNMRIRKVDASTRNIDTIVGIAGGGFSGDGGLATAAALSNPIDVFVDTSGTIYIADYFNNRIRKVEATSWKISTVAGRAGPGAYDSDGIAATTSALNFPSGIVVDAAGNMYIADLMNHRVRKVDVVTGLISTVAGTGIFGYNADGISAVTAKLNKPAEVFVDTYGNLFIAEIDNHRIRKVYEGVPGVPTPPSGPASGSVNENMAYSTSATDPGGDQIMYGWDWDGDGAVDEWSGLVASGTADSRSHPWAGAGTYSVKVRSVDEHGTQSGWSTAKTVVVSPAPAPGTTPGTTGGPSGPPAPAKENTLYVYPHPMKCPGGNAIFRMEKAGKATLQVINMRGQVVKEIVADLGASSAATVAINCADVKGGVYLIRAELKYVDGTTAKVKPYKFVVAEGK